MSLSQSTSSASITQPQSSMTPLSLPSLLNKTLRITTTDSRMFLGAFKCVDSDCNTILAQTYEYTPPPPPKNLAQSLKPGETVKMDMTSRYVGLVVVPGEYIKRVEVEEFASQIKERRLGGEKAGGVEEGG